MNSHLRKGWAMVVVIFLCWSIPSFAGASSEGEDLEVLSLKLRETKSSGVVAVVKGKLKKTVVDATYSIDAMLSDPTGIIAQSTGQIVSAANPVVQDNSNPNASLIATLDVQKKKVVLTFKVFQLSEETNYSAEIKIHRIDTAPTLLVLNGSATSMLGPTDEDPGNGGFECPSLSTICPIQFTTEVSGDSPVVGAVVTNISGVVTAIAGNFAFMQEEGGPWSGIALFGTGLGQEGVALGDEVLVSGQVEEFNGLTEILVTTITGLGPSVNVPTPIDINTGFVSDEQFEGVLLRVNDVSVVGFPNSGQMIVDDGTGNAIIDDTFTMLPAPPVGTTFSSITGVNNFSFGNFAINPREASDLQQ